MRYHLILFICVSLCDGFLSISDVEENEISPCKENPCENGGSCVVGSKEDLEDFSCKCTVGYIGEKCETELCSILACLEKEICVLENGKPECKIKEDPCKSNPCENGGSCIANSDLQDGFECNCKARYHGVTCKTDKCSILQCQENEDCVIENGDVKCIIGGKSDDTSVDPATTTSVKVTSTTIITTHKEIDNKTTTSGNTAKTTTVIEPSNTDKLLSSSSIVTRSTTAFTKATAKITKSTKNEVATTTRVSLDDHSSTSIEITSETKTDDHHKHFTVTSLSPLGNTTSSDNNRVQTSHTLTDGLTTVEYTTNTTNLFKSSSQSSPTVSSLSSTSMSTSASTLHNNSGYTSKKPQITISTPTTSKEKTEIIHFKSTGTYASTTETLNNTSANNHDPGNDIIRTNESSKSITIYASLGAVCFAVLVAFAVGGWYLRRRYRRRKRQCYTECDTSSEISRNSDSSYSSP